MKTQPIDEARTPVVGPVQARQQVRDRRAVMSRSYARAGPGWRGVEWAGNRRSLRQPLNVLFSSCLETQFFQHMSQRMRAAPARPLSPDELINGSTREGEERLIGGDTGLAAVMARARHGVP